MWAQHEQGQGLLLASREKAGDMEMPPDSLEASGVNELSVAAAVDESVTTAQTASVSFGNPPPGKKFILIIFLRLREA